MPYSLSLQAHFSPHPQSLISSSPTMYTQYILSLLLAAPMALAAPSTHPGRATSGTVQCPIVYDGRVLTNISQMPTFFDTANALFSPEFVRGNNITFSSLLKFPKDASRFDGADHTAVEVTISDQSIFKEQFGFRRAGLMFAGDAPVDEGSQGVKTLHFSVKQDPARPLNLTHEYLNVWHETADFTTNQIQFQAGTLIGNSTSKKQNFKILDRTGKQIWSIPIDFKRWQNFALTLDYTKK